MLFVLYHLFIHLLLLVFLFWSLVASKLMLFILFTTNHQQLFSFRAIEIISGYTQKLWAHAKTKWPNIYFAFFFLNNLICFSYIFIVFLIFFSVFIFFLFSFLTNVHKTNYHNWIMQSMENIPLKWENERIFTGNDKFDKIIVFIVFCFFHFTLKIYDNI